MPIKRSNGEGSISYDKARNSYRTAVTTPDGKRIYRRFKTEQEALIWKTEQLNTIHKGTFVAPSNITVGEWAIEWLTTYKKGAIKQSTYEHYLYLSTHIQSIADIKLQELKPSHVQNLLNQLLDNRLSANTVNKVNSLLKDLYSKAAKLDMINKNIMLLVNPPKFEKKQIEIFTRNEIEKLLLACRDNQTYYPMILLGATTGMRKGELLGLRWCDVNIANSEIHIRKSLQITKAFGTTLDTPKTKSSIRRIKVTEDVIKILRETKSRTTNIDIKQEKLCFVTRNETPINRHNFDRFWRESLISANIPYKKMHVLRHTHATELLASGVPIIEVSRRLGHSKISHTLELYGHAIPDYDEKIVEKVQQLYFVPK